MPQTLPTTPSTGPPPAWPIAFAWPLSESTVARTVESVICSFSHVVYSGPCRARAKNTPSSAADARSAAPPPARAPPGARLRPQPALGPPTRPDEPAQDPEPAPHDSARAQRLRTDPDWQCEARHRAEIAELPAPQEERSEVLGA